MPTLILSPRYSGDSRRLRIAAESASWAVMRLANASIPASLQGNDLAFYGETAFTERVAASRQIALIKPIPDWLSTVPAAYLQRSLRFTTLGEAQCQQTPAFIKTADEHKV